MRQGKPGEITQSLTYKGLEPCHIHLHQFSFSNTIILFNLPKQIIILLKLPRAGPYWFKEPDNMHVGSSVSSVTKGILRIANPVEENKALLRGKLGKEARSQAEEVRRMACCKGSCHGQCQWYHASLTSETFLHLEQKLFCQSAKISQAPVLCQTLCWALPSKSIVTVTLTQGGERVNLLLSLRASEK